MGMTDLARLTRWTALHIINIRAVSETPDQQFERPTGPHGRPLTREAWQCESYKLTRRRRAAVQYKGSEPKSRSPRAEDFELQADGTVRTRWTVTSRAALGATSTIRSALLAEFSLAKSYREIEPDDRKVPVTAELPHIEASVLCHYGCAGLLR